MANSNVRVVITGDNKGLKKSFVESEKVVKTSTSNMTDTIVGAGKVMGAAFAAVGTALLAKDIVMLADEYTNLNSRLKLVSEGSEGLAELQRDLFEISQETGTAYKVNAASYAKLALSLQELNVSQAEMLGISELVNKSLIVSGASTEEVSSFTLQFTQAMGSGVLQGEEFRAMMESNSYFGARLAKALDTDIAGLRKMSKEGLLTTDTLRKAFPDMASEVDEAFAEMPITIARAMREMSNSFGMVVDGANQASGGTTSIAEEFHELAETIEDNKEGIIIFFGALLSGASQAVEVVANLGQSMAGWAAVGDGRLSILEFAVMDAEELQEWLGLNNSELAGLNHQIEVSRGNIRVLADSFAISPAARKERSEAIAKEKDHIAVLNKKKAMVIAMGSAIEDTYTEQGNQTAATEKQTKADEEQAKVIRIVTDERYTALQMSKELSRESAKALEEEAQEAKRLAGDRATAYRDMYAEMDGYSQQSFEAEKTNLAKRASAYHDMGVDASVVNDWLEQQTEDLIDSYDLQYGDFFDGIRIGYDQMLEDQLTWAQAGLEVFDTFTDGAQEALSSNLVDVIKGDFDDLGAAWESLWDTMLQKMVNILVEMVAQWAAAKVADFAVAYFHDGTLEIKEDEVPAILQKGEMVIPSSQAARIRSGLDSSGEGAKDGAFDKMAQEAENMNLDMSNFGSNLATEYGKDMAKGAAGVAAGGTVSGMMDAMTHPMTSINNIAFAAAKTGQQAMGFDTTAANVGFSVAAMAAAAAGLAGPVGAVAALAGAVGVEAIADALDVREFEAFKDVMEDKKGFFKSHFDTGVFGAGHSWEQIVEADGLDALGGALEEIAHDQVDIAGEQLSNPGDYNGGFGDSDSMGVEGTGTDMGNPGSDMGNVGDDPGDMAARYGGIFSGPDQGYPIELHGTEAVVPLANGSIPVDIKGADKEGTAALLAEVKALRIEQRAANFQIAKNTGILAKIHKRWDGNGTPEERPSTQ